MHANLMLQFHYSALLGQQNVFSLPETFMLRFLLILEWHARRKNKHFYHLGILFSLWDLFWPYRLLRSQGLTLHLVQDKGTKNLRTNVIVALYTFTRLIRLLLRLHLLTGEHDRAYFSEGSQ